MIRRDVTQEFCVKKLCLVTGPTWEMKKAEMEPPKHRKLNTDAELVEIGRKR